MLCITIELKKGVKLLYALFEYSTKRDYQNIIYLMEFIINDDKRLFLEYFRYIISVIFSVLEICIEMYSARRVLIILIILFGARL